MPVTIIPASHKAKLHPEIYCATGADELLQHSCPEVYALNRTTVHATSFGDKDRVYPSSSSFIRAAVEAWGRHSHLVLRPDDFWLTILVQLNFFMGANSEKLRHLFVDHEDKKRIHISGDSWDEIIQGFEDAVPKRLKIDWMKDWIKPGFSTTTGADDMASTVLMMGLMRGYFKYSGDVICGIPSITLLGYKSDWMRLLFKIDRLTDFGDEPQEYADRLRPILTRILATFDDPAAPSTRNFWNQLVQAKVYHSIMCGRPPKQYLLSGWILGLIYWDSEGHKNTMIKPHTWQDDVALGTEEVINYGEMPFEYIPVGYAKAAFHMTSAGCEGWILAGNVGKSITDGAPEGYEALMGPVKTTAPKKFFRVLSGLWRFLNCFSGKHESDSQQDSSIRNEKARESPQPAAESGHSTIQPLSGWFLFGPRQDMGPFCDYEEADGPSVDAIDSCSGVEHREATR